MSFDELILIALYHAGTRAATIKELQSMSAVLQPDEQELQILTEGTIRTLDAMTDEAFLALDLFGGNPPIS